MYILNKYPGWIPMIADKRNLDLNFKYISAITKQNYGEDYNPNNLYSGYVLNNFLMTVVILDGNYSEIKIPIEVIEKYIILEEFKSQSIKKDKPLGRIIFNTKPENNNKTFIDDLAAILKVPPECITYTRTKI